MSSNRLPKRSQQDLSDDSDDNHRAKQTKTNKKEAVPAEELEESISSQLPYRVSGPFKDMIDQIPRQVAEVKAYRRKRFTQCFPKDTPEGQLHSAIPSATFDGYWSRGDERDLARAWSLEKEAWSIEKGSLKKYRQLWTMALLFMNCTPWDIAGVEGNFVYENSRGPRPSEDKLWTQHFMHAFAMLLPHPMWKSNVQMGSAKGLQLALQYAVILRTDDRRCWEPSLPGGQDSGFMSAFRCENRAHAGRGTSIRDIHARVRQRCTEGEIYISDYSDLFLSLERVIKAPTVPLEAEDPQPFVLTLPDLVNLRKGLDGMKNPLTGVTTWPSAEFIMTSATEPVIKQKAGDQLEIWHEFAMLDERRRAIRSERLRADEAAEEDTSDEEVADSMGSGIPESRAGSVELGS